MIILKPVIGEAHLICDCCKYNIIYDCPEDLQEDLMFNGWSYKQERRLNGKTEHYCPECGTDIPTY